MSKSWSGCPLHFAETLPIFEPESSSSANSTVGEVGNGWNGSPNNAWENRRNGLYCGRLTHSLFCSQSLHSLHRVGGSIPKWGHLLPGLYSQPKIRPNFSTVHHKRLNLEMVADNRHWADDNEQYNSSEFLQIFLDNDKLHCNYIEML